MDNIKMMHGNPDRAKNQKVVYETEDGRFRYQLDMDYCKELPKDLTSLTRLGRPTTLPATKLTQRYSSSARITM